MKINEIFYSIEGEGKRVGQPCIFIRRSGCNICCKYDGKDCDTPYRNEGKEMTVAEIMAEISKYPCKNVTLTGGEPLLPHPDLIPLRRELYKRGYKVNIETNGTIAIKTAERFPNEFFTVDYKCGCSGCEDKMNPQAFTRLLDKDVIKLVLAEEDLKGIKGIFNKLKKWGVFSRYRPYVYLSPCYGRINLQHLVDAVKSISKDYPRIGLSLQIHKIIWDPEQRGV